MITDRYLVEVKWRRGSVTYVPARVWNKVCGEAAVERRLPMLWVVLQTAPGVVSEYVVVGKGPVDRGFRVPGPLPRGLRYRNVT